MKIIARIKNDFKEKFGIPRQSGLCKEIESRIVFEPEYRVKEALRGIEGYSHLWLIWEFSEAKRDTWSPTVRPPRLGGNKRMGVFATRAPYRPNPIGLSSVRLLRIESGNDGDVLVVTGADLMNGTPIYDIKPYLAYTDSHPDASGGFADAVRGYALKVSVPDEYLCRIPQHLREDLKEILSGDPRPSYQNDDGRVYTFSFSDYEISFKVSDGVIEVCGVDNENG